MTGAIINPPRYVVLPLLLLAFLALRPSCAYACSCVMPEPPREALQQADAVFVGRVSDTAAPARRPMLTQEFPFVSWGGGMEGPRAIFEVSMVWKGRLPEEIAVDTSQIGGACGYEFAVGREYIVYAFKDEAGLTTSICTRTSLVEAAQQDRAELGAGKPPVISAPAEHAPRSSGALGAAGAIGLLAVGSAAAWRWSRRRGTG